MLLLTNSDFCQENKIVQEKMLLLVCRCLWHYLGSSVTGEESELQDIMMIAFTRLREGGSGERVTNYSWIEYIKRGTGTVEVQKLLKLWREDPARQFSFREMTKECWVPSRLFEQAVRESEEKFFRTLNADGMRSYKEIRRLFYEAAGENSATENILMAPFCILLQAELEADSERSLHQRPFEAFRTDTILCENPLWSAWCSSYAMVCATYFGHNTRISAIS